MTVEILLNFDRYGGSYYVQAMAPDARTPLSRWRKVESRETLVRLLRYLGADENTMEQFETDDHRWGRSTLRIEVPAGRGHVIGL